MRRRIFKITSCVGCPWFRPIQRRSYCGLARIHETTQNPDDNTGLLTHDVVRAVSRDCPILHGMVLDVARQCDAIVEDVRRPIKSFSRQRVTIPRWRQCESRTCEIVGHLGLCKVHARLAREGLVDQEGNVAKRADIANVRRYPQQFPGGLYHWLNEGED